MSGQSGGGGGCGGVGVGGGDDGGGRLKVAKLNEQLTCKLCKGYFIDATTIIECLHSFCRSCIVKYLETNKYCPICEVQVHKSKPLLNIRPDHTLQDIVYKIVPGCYQNEMRCRREFYEKHPEAQLSSLSPEGRGEPIESHIYSPDESLSLSLEYYNPTLNDSPICSETDEEKSSSSSTKYQPRRYLRCPAAVTVFHLQKLIRAKYGLSDAHRVDIMYKEEPLYGNYTLMDVMYIYHWRRKVPLHLSYRIFESSPKRIKLSDDNKHFKETLSNAGISTLNTNQDEHNNGKREWKEVQLKISETGVMSVTGITSPDTKKQPKKETLEEEQRRLDESVADVAKIKTEKTSEIKKKIVDDVKIEQKLENTDKSKKIEINKETTTTSEDNNNKSPSTSNSVKNTPSTEVKDKPTTTTKTTETPINTQKSNEKQMSSTKIESLTGKLQFQPKVGQVNNTYSKKSQKDKKMFLEEILKRSEGNKQETKEKNKLTTSTSVKVSAMSSSGSTVNLNAFGGCTYSTAPSVSISLRTKSPERSKGSGDNKPDDKQQNNSQSETGLNLPLIGINQSSPSSSSSSSFPYLVQNLVDSGVLKSPTKSKTQTLPSSQSQFNLQTPSMSIYSIPPTTTTTTTTTSKSQINSSSLSITTQATNSLSPKSTTKSSLEITPYSVPPCPDAIPISLMKPTVRKTEIIAKGTNLNEICAKIGNTGSKINDICAKIGESSKERDKNKNERQRPEIPDLLKITKKPTIVSDTTIGKHGQTIPNVPTYTPSNSKPTTPTSSSPSSSSATSSTSLQSLMINKSTTSNKTKSQSLGFKTLRDPPKPWNPTLSRNNYVATKNQAKEQEPNQSTSQTKQNPSKIKIFKARNNVPRYLGNPASGVKPMYGASETAVKESVKDTPTSSSSSSIKSLSMTRVDPKTLSPIVATTNSPIVSPPPYSPNARNYSPSFSRSGTSISPRNSPVNMLSTGPFIQSPTPNTNPRLFPTFLSPFPDSRFPSTLIRQPIGISAYHSSLPPSINKFYQGRYMSSPQGSSYSQSPTIQRIPPTHSTTSPKSPKITATQQLSTNTSITTNTSVNLAKINDSGDDNNKEACNLIKCTTTTATTTTTTTTTSSASDLTKTIDDKKIIIDNKKDNDNNSEKGKIDEDKCEKINNDNKKMADNNEKKEDEKILDNKINEDCNNKTHNGINNEPSSSTKNDNNDKLQDKECCSEPSDNINDKREESKGEEVIVSESKCEELNKDKEREAQRNKPES